MKTNLRLGRFNPLYFFMPLLAGFGVITVIVVLFFGVILSAFLWPYTINTWLAYVGKPPEVVWWEGILLAFVPGIGQMAVFAAVVTWIAMMFLS